MTRCHAYWSATLIRAFRYWLDITQRELAEKIGVKMGTVTVWETGRARCGLWRGWRFDDLLEKMEQERGERFIEWLDCQEPTGYKKMTSHDLFLAQFHLSGMEL